MLKTKKTIAMLLFNTFPGDGRVFREANSLIKTNIFEVTVFAWKRPKEDFSGFQESIKISRVDTKSPMNIKKIKDLFLFNILLFLRLLRLPRYSVYQAHDFTTLPTAFAIAKLKNSKVVYDSHEYYPALLASDKIINRFFLTSVIELEKLLSNHVNLMLTAERAKANVFRRKYGIKKIEVIFNAPGITEENIEQLALKREIFKKKWHVENFDFLIIYPGAINPGRCLEELIEAVPALIKLKRVKILLIGGSSTGLDFRTYLNNLIEAKNLQTSVEMLDLIPNTEVAELYTVCDLVYAMYPKIRDYVVSIPTKVLDAARFKKPFLTSNFGEMKALANKLPLGMAVNPETSEITSALVKLVNTPPEISEVNLHDFEELWWDIQENKIQKSFLDLF